MILNIKRSLKNKLILSYLVVALITVLVVSILIYFNSSKSLMDLVVGQQTAELSDTVTAYFESNGSLDGFSEYYLRPNAPDQPGSDHPDKRDFRGVEGLVDANYRVLLPTGDYEVGQNVPPEMVNRAVSVQVDGETIAWILPDTSFQFSLSPEEQRYLDRSTLAIGFAALAGVLAAVGMGFLLAGNLLKPIRRLTRASQSLANGVFQTQVPVTSEDELGKLTETFNQMSADLGSADQQRKRLTADITHDLSTPIQIISGYIEMLEDNHVSLTPQRIEIIKTELENLQRLVGDLKTLSQIEGGGIDIQFQAVQPVSLLEELARVYQPIAARQNVELVLESAENIPPIVVDKGRVSQILKNLIDNALRYTPEGGKVTLGVAFTGQVELRVSDTGSGIEAADLPFVFDRFYRADKARSSSEGKSSLGLAICKALALALGGSIRAESAGKDRGTTMIVAFPPA